MLEDMNGHALPPEALDDLPAVQMKLTHRIARKSFLLE
jgi:hypothetical protein